MPTLTVTPNPATPSTVVSVSGTNFINTKTRLILDGVGASTNIFRPRKDGTFSVGITVSSAPKTQILVAEQLINGVWSEKARTSIVVQAVVTPPPPPPAGTYTFFEDFTSATLDPNKWVETEWPTTGLSFESDNSYSIKTTPDGHPPMCSVVNNQLRIRCERGSTPSGRAWRSGAIATGHSGNDAKFQQLYGIFQARMKYPKGQGLWPAFWLLEGNKTSGRRPELDIIEAYPFGDTSSRGGGPTEYAMTNHYKDSSGTMQAQSLWVKSGIDLTQDFHVYEMEWRQGLMIARLDGKEMGRITSNVPSTPMFIIVNMVVGGWAGPSDGTTPNPSDMFVDWIRASA